MRLKTLNYNNLDFELDFPKIKVDLDCVLVIGGAGSIGSNYIKQIIKFKPKRIVVVDLNMIFYMSLVVVASGTYTIRALYFSIMQEGKIPIALTGTAVGVISVIGYMPDIFATPLFGYFLDKHPGIVGHQYVFGILTIFSIVGLSASIKFVIFI